MPRKAKSNKLTTSKLISQLKKEGKLHVYTKKGYKIPLKIACPEIINKKKHTVRRSKRIVNKQSEKTRSRRPYKRRGGSKHSTKHVKNNNTNTKIKNTNTNNNNNNKGLLLKDVERNLVNRLENLGINSKFINEV